MRRARVPSPQRRAREDPALLPVRHRAAQQRARESLQTEAARGVVDAFRVDDTARAPRNERIGNLGLAVSSRLARVPTRLRQRVALRVAVTSLVRRGRANVSTRLGARGRRRGGRSDRDVQGRRARRRADLFSERRTRTRRTPRASRRRPEAMRSRALPPPTPPSSSGERRNASSPGKRAPSRPLHHHDAASPTVNRRDTPMRRKFSGTRCYFMYQLHPNDVSLRPAASRALRAAMSLRRLAAVATREVARESRARDPPARVPRPASAAFVQTGAIARTHPHAYSSSAAAAPTAPRRASRRAVPPRERAPRLEQSRDAQARDASARVVHAAPSGAAPAASSALPTRASAQSLRAPWRTRI